MRDLVALTGDYRPNERTCWYNKTNLNTNSNFTNEVQIVEKNEFNIPSSWDTLNLCPFTTFGLNRTGLCTGLWGLWHCCASHELAAYM